MARPETALFAHDRHKHVHHNAVAGQSGPSRAQPEDDPLYKPELYDIVTPASFRGDAEWYRSKARQCGGPVLELGAGTGRITLGIAHDGVRVHALDTDPVMLERLTEKLAQQPPEVREHVVVMVGDMRTFTLTERFALIRAVSWIPAQPDGTRSARLP